MNSNADRKVNRLQTLVGTVAARMEQHQILYAASVACCHKCTYSLRHGLKRVCERPTCSSLLRLRSTKPNNYAQKSAAGFGLPLKSRRKKTGSIQFFHESHDECERRRNETGLLKWRGDVGGHEDASWNWNFLRYFLCRVMIAWDLYILMLCTVLEPFSKVFPGPDVLYVTLWAARVYVLSMSGDQALHSAGCVSVPLSSILWRVASVSTLVFFPLLLLAQLELQDAPPGIWKSWNDSLKQAETMCFFGFG